MKTASLTRAQLVRLRRVDGCTLANAIESFEVRLRNVGFTNSQIRCLFPDMPAVAGFAVTARVRTAAPPMEGQTYYYRTDWWNHVVRVPEPRIVVIEDIDRPPGLGASIGETHASILRALGCVAVVTNGAVRSLPAARAAGFQMFSGNTSVAHAYAHIVDFGGTVTVAGMEVHPGDLLHGDLHGVQTVPAGIVEEITAKAEKIIREKRRIVDLCRSGEFSLEKIREELGIKQAGSGFPKK